jgi:STE24 endopeptidase
MPGPDEPLRRAKDYQKIKQVLTLWNLGLTPLLILIPAVTPLSGLFYSWASSVIGCRYGALAFYFMFLSLFFMIFDLPLSFYSGYMLEHRFKLSNLTLKGWGGVFVKKALLSFGLSLALLEGLYALIWNFPERWWIFAWVCYAGVSYGIGKLFPVLIVPIFYQYSPLENPELKDRILKMAGRYGMPVENVYSLNLSKTTKKANAAFMGLGRTKRVVLSDTLLKDFTPDEVETVVAHELGHYVHRDIWKHLAVSLATSFAAFWIVFQTAGPLCEKMGYCGPADVAAMPVLFLVFYFFSLMLTPFQSALGRWMERAADRFSLEAFPHPAAFISAMNKLGAMNLADPSPHPLYEWFFYDHPAIPKRVRMAEQWKVGKEIKP